MKKLPIVMPHNSVKKVSKIISDYLDECLMEDPNEHKFIEHLKYWKNHQQQ